jgi:hypothetical protein
MRLHRPNACGCLASRPPGRRHMWASDNDRSGGIQADSISASQRPQLAGSTHPGSAEKAAARALSNCFSVRPVKARLNLSLLRDLQRVVDLDAKYHTVLSSFG